MGRILKSMTVQGDSFWTLFDTGSRKTYITPAVAKNTTVKERRKPLKTKLGGETKISTQVALIEAELDGFVFEIHAEVVDSIGNDGSERAIEILFGAIAMQEYGIRPLPETEELDLSHYPEEFLEF